MLSIHHPTKSNHGCVEQTILRDRRMRLEETSSRQEGGCRWKDKTLCVVRSISSVSIYIRNIINFDKTHQRRSFQTMKSNRTFYTQYLFEFIYDPARNMGVWPLSTHKLWWPKQRQPPLGFRLESVRKNYLPVICYTLTWICVCLSIKKNTTGVLRDPVAWSRASAPISFRVRRLAGILPQPHQYLQCEGDDDIVCE